MNNRIKFLIVAYLVGLFKLTSVIQGQKSSPNVILIYTDDHGYTDIGALGIDKNVDTPNMDKLARGGALMTAGYSTAPQCVPSRAGLMIGRVQNEFAFRTTDATPVKAWAVYPAPTPRALTWPGNPYLPSPIE